MWLHSSYVSTNISNATPKIVKYSTHENIPGNRHIASDHSIGEKLWEIIQTLVGKGVRNMRRGHNQRHVGPSCVGLVYFLSKSTEFHIIQTEYQITLFHFLLLISYHSWFALSAALFCSCSQYLISDILFL